ncbi:DNA sulfur modification protein DndB [Vibrio jasicida]|uniref:DNA sulfur modification protein DndB n=1 Tax=Vibrio jasicida TaxID=766224 RepID=UPI00391EEA60
MSYSWVYTLPAARGIQAGRCFYNVTMPMRVLTKLLRIDDGQTLSRSQRLVNLSRARKVDSSCAIEGIYLRAPEQR